LSSSSGTSDKGSHPSPSAGTSPVSTSGGSGGYGFGIDSPDSGSNPMDKIVPIVTIAFLDLFFILVILLSVVCAESET
jgi:preprotein translocase subunit SecG